jgi:hypothetical protein
LAGLTVLTGLAVLSLLSSLAVLAALAGTASSAVAGYGFTSDYLAVSDKGSAVPVDKDSTAVCAAGMTAGKSVGAFDAMGTVHAPDAINAIGTCQAVLAVETVNAQVRIVGVLVYIRLWGQTRYGWLSLILFLLLERLKIIDVFRNDVDVLAR